ncbi:hypothetical protein TNCV_530211 [Trichonephila clavipes]|nr:hypothetical protein TNCV_530211 [Trichonephila clavipes]
MEMLCKSKSVIVEELHSSRRPIWRALMAERNRQFTHNQIATNLATSTGANVSARYIDLASWFYIGNKGVNEFLWQMVPLVKHRVLGFGGRLRVAIALLRASQTYYIGLKSGDLAGQSIRQISSFSRNNVWPLIIVP